MIKNILLALMLTTSIALPSFAQDAAEGLRPFTIQEAATQINGTLTVAGATTLTTPLASSNIASGRSTRNQLRAVLTPSTGAAANSTTYSDVIFPGRAGTVKAIYFGAATAPVGGTETLKVLNGTSSGATMLSTATLDATTLVSGVATVGTLTATPANLAVTATGGIYVSFAAGTQATPAANLSVTIEYEPNSF